MPCKRLIKSRCSITTNMTTALQAKHCSQVYKSLWFKKTLNILPFSYKRHDQFTIKEGKLVE
jgi:hypothetical protein